MCEVLRIANRSLAMWSIAILAVVVSSSLTLGQTCTPAASGIAGWWPGDGDTTELIGGNSAVLQNGTGFTFGEAGLAFSLDGADDFISIPASAALDVGIGSGMTIECWINPADISRS